MSLLFHYIGLVLRVVAPVLAIRAAVRTREVRRLDVAAFLICLALVPWFPQGAPGTPLIRTGLQVFQPYFALRLVRHFRPVPLAGLWLAFVVASGITSWHAMAGAGPALRLVRFSYFGLSLALVAAAFAVEARRSTGVKTRRLLLAAAGSGSFALTALIVLAGSTFIPSWFGRQVEGLAVICYFFAFTPPQRLISRWRRAEQADYVGRGVEREPEERGWLASQDLVDGAGRTVGGSLALVARRHDSSAELAVVAASDQKLAGWRFTPHERLIGRSVTEALPMLGRTTTCEDDVAKRLAPYGELVLVAPIAASGQGSGVVITVHRRGALFPEDDLSSLAQMARTAAVAIDHAALVRERRAAVQEVANRRLRELENRVGVMVDSIRDYALLVVDASGAVAAWHLGAEHLFGHSRDQIARRPVASLFGTTESEMVEWLAAARDGGTADREGECLRADGTKFIGATTIRPLLPESGMPPGFVIVTHDVTEQRRLEERVRQGQKMEAIGTLASGVAHDFNNILAAIIGHADWLESEMAGDTKLEQVIEIQRAAERGVDMTQQLLAFGRREAPKPVAIDLTYQVRGLLPMLRRLIGSHIEIVDATMPDVPPISGNRSQVEQVILNLAVNARDAMAAGGRLTFRTVETSVEGDSRSAGAHVDHVLLEVSDTGIGMDAETRRRAFEPFFTTKDVGQGTGLGLSTVYGIVQDMRGLIDIDSAPGRGTTFRVYFPRANGLARLEPAAAAARATGETILLIEDDASLRAYLRHVLEERGYLVLEASGPLAALSVVAKHSESIRLVVSDVAMPGMSGPALVAELAKQSPGLTAVFISGHADGEAARFGAPADSRWLQKPFSPTDLLDEIERVLAPS